MFLMILWMTASQLLPSSTSLAHPRNILVLKLSPEWQVSKEQNIPFGKKIDYLRNHEKFTKANEKISQTIWQSKHTQLDELMRGEETALLENNCRSEISKPFLLFECPGAGWSGVKKFVRVNEHHMQAISFDVREVPLSERSRKRIESFLTQRVLLCEQGKPKECLAKMKEAEALNSRHTALHNGF